ncbi:MAG: hypothetical protein IJI88_04300 [Atopobiaceae bacterium]|nr:hypothetical protein [Atopobiaceae bacterium]
MQGYDAGIIPAELEHIPDAYRTPAEHPGTLERLDYQTYDSFNFGVPGHELEKTAWVYVPYGYDPERRYDVLYLSHGGWSNETTQMGTPDNPSRLKLAVDHAIEDGLIEPLIMVMPTYNNLSASDSGDYSLALQLTDNFHNELTESLIPAVESRYSTHAEDVTPEGIAASRDHRAFGGFSMGSVNTWHTFEYCLPYFSMFIPMSGGGGWSGAYLSSLVTAYGLGPGDFFIFGMSGTEDFAYSGFRSQVLRLASEAPRTFVMADSLDAGNVAFRERAGYQHDQTACDEYTYNGLRLFFNGARRAEEDAAEMAPAAFTQTSTIDEVVSDPAFGDWGRLIFPVDQGYMSGSTLGDLSLTWYSRLDPTMTVDIVNDLHVRASTGQPVFIDLYSDEEKAADPWKADTGLFFFPGKPGARTAIVSAGGGFAYVGALHDSLPHCLELSRRGYNAFAIIYRPGAQTACEDLARAIALLHERTDELGISMEGYSLWGGSAGARMSAWLGAYGTESFGEAAYPRPAACIVNYTGLSEVTGAEPPTYSAVGTADGIASWRTMQTRIERIQANGTPAQIEIFNGLGHGFGLGTGTVAEKWMDNAIAFWEENA